MENIVEALRVTGLGLVVVFTVMAIIASATWLSGRVFVALERRAAARKPVEGGDGGGAP